MLDRFSKFYRDESGATAIEYGIIVGLISIVIVASMVLVKDKLLVLFELIGEALDSA